MLFPGTALELKAQAYLSKNKQKNLKTKVQSVFLI